jgi:hypothetical protein
MHDPGKRERDGMKKIITAEWVARNLQEVADAAGHGFRYFDYYYPDRIADSAHYFSEKGEPRCMIGHLLPRLGLTAEKLVGTEVNYAGITVLMSRVLYPMGYELEHAAWTMLSEAQRKQDSGMPWGDVAWYAVENYRVLAMEPYVTQIDGEEYTFVSRRSYEDTMDDIQAAEMGHRLHDTSAIPVVGTATMIQMSTEAEKSWVARAQKIMEELTAVGLAAMKAAEAMAEAVATVVKARVHRKQSEPIATPDNGGTTVEEVEVPDYVPAEWSEARVLSRPRC